MKPVLLLTLLAMAADAQTAIRPAASMTSIQSKAISRQILGQLESDFDAKIGNRADADEFELLGNTRGVQLPGYGVVFTAELDLVHTPGPSPMGLNLSPQRIQQIHAQKLKNLQRLYLAMKEFMTGAGKALSALPPDQKIVFAVRLDYRSYEDLAGLPAQAYMSATRADAAAGTVQLEPPTEQWK